MSLFVRRGPTALLVLLAASSLSAQPTSTPTVLEGAGLDQRIGETVPLELPFVDHTGAAVELGDFFGERPVVLAPVYYDCPMLCGMVLDGLASSLDVLAFGAGDEFEVVAVSIDPEETPRQAAARRAAQLERYGRPGAEDGFHFLTGSPEAVARLTEAIGFRYAQDEESGEFAHTAGLVLATPDGRIARQLFGVEYAPRDLRLGLVEAGEGHIGGLVDSVLLYCFHYDPQIGRYSAITMNMVRLGGVVTLLALGSFVLLMLWRERRAGAVPAVAGEAGGAPGGGR